MGIRIINRSSDLDHLSVGNIVLEIDFCSERTMVWLYNIIEIHNVPPLRLYSYSEITNLTDMTMRQSFINRVVSFELSKGHKYIMFDSYNDFINYLPVELVFSSVKTLNFMTWTGKPE